MNMNRILTLIAAFAAVFVFAAGSFGSDAALAHHKPDHSQGPQADATATSVSPQPTSTSPQPTPTSVSPQPTPTPGPTSTPRPERTPLAEDQRYGWGCGDENHEHVGPAGNPDAESPCDKHDDAMTASAEGDDEQGNGHGKPEKAEKAEKAAKHDED
ncbi:MAG TPA: hypothetical protein VFN74_06415 [Chloroflexota bacterium]|nr:hypothetical protein [Chloroflexota bacterium]